ncbi:ABC transporter substrate-binding protein [Anaerobacillus alkalidiazotrophicus]|uniref:ABC transporter substrate-binding protein n=1 Tax=Anaerobacillus alkalidiazotrophicus TaxID=472963 RepID=UPI000AA506B2|nr:ABC transporter substrate-binding protein [Anaerobacillus alkalidiazotrophicus]
MNWSKLNRKWYTALLVGLLSLFVLSACGQEEVAKKEETTDLAVASETIDPQANGEIEQTDVTLWGVIGPQVSGQQIIADKLGYFAEEGLNVNSRLVQSGPDIGPMIASGDAQLSFETTITNITVSSNNIPTVIVAPMANIAGTQAVVARPGLEITSAKDIEGKKVGMVNGAGIMIAFQNMAKEMGVDVSKVQFVNIAPADQIAALERGDIDIMAAWEPWITKAIEIGGTLLFSGTEAHLPEKDGSVDWMRFYSTFQVNRNYLEQNPNTVKALLRALNRATDYINANSDDAAVILQEEMPHLTLEEVKEMMGRNVYSMEVPQAMIDGSNEIAEFLLEMNNITNLPDFDSYTDFSLLNEVLNEN